MISDENGNLCVRPAILGLPHHFFLTNDGTATGTYNLNGNYSAAPTDFSFVAPARFDIYTLIVSIADEEAFWVTDYGTLGVLDPVVNGAKFYIRPYGSSVEYQLLMRNNIGITKNYQWFQITADVSLSTFAGGVGQVLSVVFHITEEYGQPLIMYPGDTLIVRLQDNFSELISHTFGVRGILQVKTPVQ